MFKKILNYITNNRKTILIFLGIFIIFYFSDLSFANNVKNATDEKADLIEKINGIFILLSTLIWIVTQFVWLFLHPAWTSWEVFWMTNYIHELWILVSNVVYLIFIFLLIAIAFMNIIWKWDWTFELKQALPKLLLWVLMVPLSWVLIAWLISISSMLAASILTLPFDTFQNQPAVKEFLAKKICTHPVTTTSEKKKWDEIESSVEADGTTISVVGDQVSTTKCRSEEDKVLISTLLYWPRSAYWILNIYTYWVFALDETMVLYSESISDKVSTLFDLIIKIGFDIVFIIIYFILVIALWFALFVRWVALWIYMIFSPVFWIFIFFWKGWSGFNEKFSIKELVALAMVPVYVSWALAFWLLFLSIVWNWLATSPTTNIINIKKNTDKTSTLEILGTYEHTFDLAFSNSANIQAADSVNQLFSTWLWAVWIIILDLFWLIILWLWVITALSASKITGSIIAPISELWKSAWSLMMNAPKYIPLPFTKWHTLTSLQNAAEKTKATIEWNAAYKWAALWQAIWDYASKAMWIQSDWAMRVLLSGKTDERLKAIESAVKGGDNKVISNQINLLIKEVVRWWKFKNANEFIKSNAFDKTMEMLWNKMWFSEEQIKKLQNVTTESQLDTTWRDVATAPTTNAKVKIAMFNADGGEWENSSMSELIKSTIDNSDSDSISTSKYIKNTEKWPTSLRGNKWNDIKLNNRYENNDNNLQNNDIPLIAKYLEQEWITKEWEIKDVLLSLKIDEKEIGKEMKALWKHLKTDEKWKLVYNETATWTWNTNWVEKTSSSNPWSGGWGFNAVPLEAEDGKFNVRIWAYNIVVKDNKIEKESDIKQMVQYMEKQWLLWEMEESKFKKILDNDFEIKQTTEQQEIIKRMKKYVKKDDSWKPIINKNNNWNIKAVDWTWTDFLKTEAWNNTTTPVNETENSWASTDSTT